MSKKEEKEYLIPLEDIPKFLSMQGISAQDFAVFFNENLAMQSKETMNNFKDAVTPEQYAKTMTRFEKSNMIVSQSFDRLFYTPIQYAILRNAEKTMKRKDGKILGELADSMKKSMIDINFDEPIRLTQKDIEFLKKDMKLNFKSQK